MPDQQKTWWAPVWRGLVIDPEGKHYRRLKGAIWLLLYLILRADWATGTLLCKLPTITRHTGIPRRTLQRWFRRLQAGGYITVQETGRAVRIGIRKWKTLKRASKVAPLKRQIWHPRGATLARPEV